MDSRPVFTLHKASWQVGIKYDYVMLVKSCGWVQEHVFQEKAPMDCPAVGARASPNQRMCLSPLSAEAENRPTMALPENLLSIL